MSSQTFPDDVLLEILSHFFHIDVDAPPPKRDLYGETRPRGPTPIGQSTSLLLVSKHFRSLVQPFIWQTILIDQPSDFPLFFAPKTGLLHAKNKLGKARRGWVRELVLGRDAAVPYDGAKVRDEIKTYAEIMEGADYDVHVDLLPTQLVNLKRVTLGHAAYIAPFAVGDRSISHIGDWIDFDSGYSEREAADPTGYPFVDLCCDMYGWLWTDLAHRNDEIIARLLAPLAPDLAVFCAPFVPSPGWTDSIMMLGGGGRPRIPWTLTARIPTSIKKAKGLKVILTCNEPAKGYGDRSPTLEQARALKALLPKDANVEAHWTKYAERYFIKPRNQADEGTAESEDNEWANWTWVNEDGSRWPIGPESLRKDPKPSDY